MPDTHQQRPHISAIILAAGSGSRISTHPRKQYAPLAGRPLIAHTINTFAAHQAITTIQVVIHADDEKRYQDLCANQSWDLHPVVIGGAKRQISVRLGLEALANPDHGLAPSYVLIHDGARPWIDSTTIDRIIQALKTNDGAVAATPLNDSLIKAQRGQAKTMVDRTDLWRAFTPQGFVFGKILAAHRACAHNDYTDDTGVALSQGLRVCLVPDQPSNSKITHDDDLARAQHLMSNQPSSDNITRVGHGFDVHRLVDGDSITLCGVTIDFHKSLSGHSDADVGLHALTDAILGAIADGDIGTHFPPSEQKWKDTNSMIFLDFSRKEVKKRGGRILHVDVTLICEQPKISPHSSTMRQTIAQALKLNKDNVSVKATTTEGLSFTGRGEGIAAMATATVVLP